jgi:uncharacterized protein
VKGTDRPDSDVDLLVEFEPAATPSLFDMAGIEIELSAQDGAEQRKAADVMAATERGKGFRIVKQVVS